ncbi:MAG: hypothetical protein NTW86_12930 [Candidatus Sumerlaeota bacterium]|nr:hypothetical protein [Candidatus Sumerlaeota bacterium]
MSVLVLTADPLPLPGLAATGAGLRAWSLAKGLEAAGLEARAAMPAVLLAGRADPRAEPYCSHVYPAFDAAGFVQQEAPDVVVVQHWGMLRRLSRCDCPLALDLAGPHLLERRHWGQVDLGPDIGEKIEALSRADFVACSGRDQRLYFLAWLAMAGFDLGDPELCPAIPFSWSPEGPEREEPPGAGREIRFVSGGVLLPWQNPRPAIETLLGALDEAGRGRLLYHAGAHPAVNVAGGEHHALLEMLENHPRAETHGLLPFDEWVKLLTRVDAALDILPRNNERELAFPTRTAIYLWSGLPTLHANYDELGRMIGEADAGWALDPNDPEGLRRAVFDILERPSELETMGAAARRLAAERLNWAKTIEPLAQFCRHPARREKRPTRFAGSAGDSMRVQALERDLREARNELAALRGKWPMRWARRAKCVAWLAFPFVYVGAFLAAVFVAIGAFVSDLLAGHPAKK